LVKTGLASFFGLVGSAAYFFDFPAFFGEFFSHGCVVGAVGGFGHVEFAECFEDFVQFDSFSGDELGFDPVSDGFGAWSGFFAHRDFGFDEFVLGGVFVSRVAEGGGESFEGEYVCVFDFDDGDFCSEGFAEFDELGVVFFVREEVSVVRGFQH